MKKLIISLSLSCIAFSGFSQQDAKSSIINTQPIHGDGIARSYNYSIPACATTNGGWLIGGNSMSNVPVPAGYTFIGGQVLGTCDNWDLVLEANSLQSMWLKPSGKIGIGVGSSNPSGQLDIVTSGTTSGLNILNGTSNLFSVGNDGATVINTMLGENSLNYPAFKVASGYAPNIISAYANGYIGIGTQMPLAQLDISCYQSFISPFQIEGTNSNTGSTHSTVFRINPDGSTLINCISASSPLKITNSTLPTGTGSAAQTDFEVTASGKVYIGPKRPTSGNHDGSLLSVDGDITTTALYVTDPAAKWSDYVFDKNYKLMPLSELEAFYKQNHHLPSVPTTKEIQENGNNLAETDAVLLQKVEELTLYLVQQQKVLAQQQESLQQQQEEITELKKKLNHK